MAERQNVDYPGVLPQGSSETSWRLNQAVSREIDTERRSLLFHLSIHNIRLVANDTAHSTKYRKDKIPLWSTRPSIADLAVRFRCIPLAAEAACHAFSNPSTLQTSKTWLL